MALYWMARGEGYELTGADVGAARDHATTAAAGTLTPGTHVSERITANVAGDGPAARWVCGSASDSTRTRDVGDGKVIRRHVWSAVNSAA